MTAPIVLDKDPQDKRSKMPWIAAGVAAATLAVGTIFGIHTYAVHENKQARDDERDLEAAVEADGFSVEDIYWTRSDEGRLILNLGNCAIDSVSVEIRGDGTSTDVTEYSYDGYANAITSTERVEDGGMVDITHGTPVEFKFSDRADLESNILGSEPCKTLAGNLQQPR